MTTRTEGNLKAGGAPSDGISRLVASIAIGMAPPESVKRQVIAAVLEALQARYQNVPAEVNVDSIARTWRRIEQGKQQPIAYPPDLRAAAIAALESHPLSDEAASYLAQLKINRNSFVAEATAYLRARQA